MIAGVAENDTELGNYSAGSQGIEILISSVPEMNQYAQVTGEQACNLNTHEKTSEIWLTLAHRVIAAMFQKY